MVNPIYPVYGSYIKSISNAAAKCFQLRDYFQEYLKIISHDKVHDVVTCAGNLHQLFIKAKMPIVFEPTQLSTAVRNAQNKSLQEQMFSKRDDPCPICMNEYNAPVIHSRVTFRCCSAQCCNTCFDEMVALVHPFGNTTTDRLQKYSRVRCFMCRKVAGSDLILEVTNPLIFPPGMPDRKKILSDINAE